MSKISFVKYPFLFIFLFFSIGVWFSANFQLNKIIPLTCIYLLVGCAIFFMLLSSLYAKAHLFIFFFVSFLFLIGVVLSEGNLVVRSFQENLSYDKEFVLQGKCESFEIGKGKTNSMILNVNSVFVGDYKKMKKQNTLCKILVYTFKSDSLDFNKGDSVYIQSKLEKINNVEISSVTLFDSESYWANKGIRYYTFISKNNFHKINGNNHAFLYKLKNANVFFQKKIELKLNKDEFGVAKALLLGDKGGLTNEIKSQFSNSGALHFLAVSGLHVGIFLYIILAFFKLFAKYLSRNNAVFISLLLLWVYAFFVGASPSVLRSTLMFSIFLVSTLLDRNSNSINILFFSGFILLVYNTNYLFDVGYQLSYLAVLGIIIFNPFLEKIFYSKNKFLNKIIQAITISISTQVATFPLLIFYFYKFPNYFIVSNILLMFLILLAMIIGLFVLLFASVPILLDFISFLFSFVLNWILEIVKWIDNLPYAVSKGIQISIYEVFIYYLILGFLYYTIQSKRIRLFYLGLTLCFFLFFKLSFNKYLFLDTSKVLHDREKGIVFIRKHNSNYIVSIGEYDKSKEFIHQIFTQWYESKKDTIIRLDKNESFDLIMNNRVVLSNKQ